jgi:glutamate/aspartate transport system substrate-binding protein
MNPDSINVFAVRRRGPRPSLVARAALLLLAAAAVTLAGGGAAWAQAFEVPYTGTLKKIRDSGVIVVGYRENSPPFAFIGPNRKPVGYALDLCEVVIEEIASELHKEIRAEYRPVTPENRFDLVRGGAIDLECGSTTNNFERRKIVAFSPTMFVTGTKLLVKRGSGIRSLRDLQGKTVVLTRGTVHADAIPKLAQRQKLAIDFIFGADHNESFQLLASGRAQAFANDDIQLYGIVAQTKTASDYRVVGDFLTYADYALMIRKDDPEFADVVSRAFDRLAGSREIVAIYNKWFMRPLPSGERLNLPMSPHLEEMFKVHGLTID